MSLIKNLRAKAVQNLPKITIEGEEFYVRSIPQSEYTDLLDDCMAYSRNKTSEKLKKTEPNPLKVKILDGLFAQNPEISNLIGKVDMKDAYSVAVAHGVIVCFIQMQCTRALTSMDGTMAFKSIEERMEVVDVLMNDESITLAINELMTSKQGQVEGNGLPDNSTV